MKWSVEQLLDDLRAARRRTLALVEDLSDEQLEVAHLEIVNPFRWELGHVAFFHDAFIRGYLDGDPPLIEHAARLYDSFRVAHDDRWDLPLPSRIETLDYMGRVEQAVCNRLLSRDPDGRDAYCYRLATLHEDMHGEAFIYMRQTLGYPPPRGASDARDSAGPHPGDVEIPGSVSRLGAEPGALDFTFDNEKWSHEVTVAPFRIAKAPVTNAEFAAFVDAGGYEREELWSHEGWLWQRREGITAPEYWQRVGGTWHVREYDGPVPLAPHRPVCHVSYHEAEAFCAFAGRRLPTEAEWECAALLDPESGRKQRNPWGGAPSAPDLARLDAVDGCVDVAAYPAGDSVTGCRQMIGNVWEWTSSAFYPFPGYVVDEPYREYSAPWFGDRQVLKGGAYATSRRLGYGTYRNFFQPWRRDVIAGFRTCARS